MDYKFDTETGLPSVGDMIADGASIVWEDDAQKTVTLIRQGDKIHIRTDWKNLQAMLEENVRQANEHSATSALGDFVKVASIPVGIYSEWNDEGIIRDDVALARRLNDGDYRKFRTNNIKI